MKLDILRVTTISLSLEKLLRGQLKFMEQNGFKIGTVSNGEFSHQPHYNVKSLSRSINPLKDLSAIWKLIGIIRKTKPQIVHSHTPKAGMVAMIAAKLCGVKYRVHTVAGLPLMEKQGLFRKLLILIERITYSAATHVLPNSFGLAKFINDEYYAGNKLKVLGHGSSNGIDINHFNPEAISVAQISELKNNLGIHSSDLVYFFIGRVVRDKGIEELVLAFREIQKSNANVKLLLVGPFEPNLDPISEEVKSEIENNSSIISVGFVEDVRPYIAVGDVLVFPSYREGFPNVPMQAACLKKALILSDINGCNEQIEHDKSGLLIKPKSVSELVQAMTYYSKNESSRRAHAEAAYNHIRAHYSQDVVWNEILKFYRSLQ